MDWLRRARTSLQISPADSGNRYAVCWLRAPTLRECTAQRSPVDHYIVQIYRRGALGQLHGVVERVGNGGRRSFSSVEELFSILQEPVDDRGHPEGVR